MINNYIKLYSLSWCHSVSRRMKVSRLSSHETLGHPSVQRDPRHDATGHEMWIQSQRAPPCHESSSWHWRTTCERGVYFVEMKMNILSGEAIIYSWSEKVKDIHVPICSSEISETWWAQFYHSYFIIREVDFSLFKRLSQSFCNWSGCQANNHEVNQIAAGFAAHFLTEGCTTHYNSCVSGVRSLQIEWSAPKEQIQTAQPLATWGKLIWLWWHQRTCHVWVAQGQRAG